MHSCIYEGVVRHRRYAEARHEFRNALFLMYLDLDEVASVFRGRWFWSANRPAPARFCREDHVGPAAESLAETIRDLVDARCGFRPVGPIRLLTSLRYFGYVINPVSFFFCYDADGQSVVAVVAEVTNTPWGERHCYVIDSRSVGAEIGSPDQRVLRAEHGKDFHVSPFMPMDTQYRWRITHPSQRLIIQIQVQRDNDRAFDATLVLHRRDITTASLAGVLLRHPFMTAQVAGSIYWQALRLWMKRVTFHPHPDRPQSSVEKSPVLTATLPSKRVSSGIRR